MTQRAYGWKRDGFDPRDKILQCSLGRPWPLSPFWSLIDSPHQPPIYDQSAVGSCVGNGVSAVADYARHKQGLEFLSPSRLGVYYGAREREGTVAEDAGATIRDGMWAVVEEGIAPESLWPYDTTKVFEKPPEAYYLEAAKHQALRYLRISQADYYIGHCLEHLGAPIVFGVELFAEFESAAVAANGMVPMPQLGQTPIGGHCMVIVARDEVSDLYGLRNSWGTGWGQGGYCWVPRNYILSSLAGDFWAIIQEEADVAIKI